MINEFIIAAVVVTHICKPDIHLLQLHIFVVTVSFHLTGTQLHCGLGDVTCTSSHTNRLTVSKIELLLQTILVC